MYSDVVPNRNSPPAILLREARRQGKKIVKVTLANLSHLPPERIDILRRALKGALDGLAFGRTPAALEVTVSEVMHDLDRLCLQHQWLAPEVRLARLPQPTAAQGEYLKALGLHLPEAV
jgi:hypothetical protein